MGLILGLLAAILLGAAGFYATYSGMIGAPKGSSASELPQKNGADSGKPAVGFVALDPLIISLGPHATNRYLRFAAQLEVAPEFEDEVSLLKPRVADALNEYLRAVDARDIENPASFGRLRAQMLRRIQVVTGRGRVRDLLITEFVLN